MTGRYCTVEPLEVESHAAALFDAYADAPDGRDWSYLFTPPPSDFATFQAYVASAAASLDPLNFAIVDHATGAAVGIAALMRIDPVHGVIEVGGVSYSPRLQRTRASTGLPGGWSWSSRRHSVRQAWKRFQRPNPR